MQNKKGKLVMDLVQVQNNQVVVSSLDVAEHFRKRHCDVLEAIRVEMGVTENSVDPLEAEMFYETTYTHPQNKQEYPMILMNRDGFSLVVMGFTGKKASEWKRKYIYAFNEMERRLKEQAPQLSPVEMIAQIAQNAVEQERRLKAIELQGSNTAAEVREIKKAFTQKDTLETDVKDLVNRMIKEGYSKNYADAYNRLYKELQNLTGARINQRWNNKSEEEKKKISRLKMIMSDKKLRAGMIAAYESLARQLLNNEV